MTTETSIDIEQLLANFGIIASQVLAKVEAASNFEDYESALGEGAKILAKAIIKIGEASKEKTKEASPKNIDKQFLPANIINYLWAGEAKSLMLLWRDVLLQQQKAKIMELDGKVSKSDLLHLRDKSTEVLKKAVKELCTLFDTSLNTYSKPSNENKKKIEQWAFQKNPWSIYHAHIEQIVKQCGEAEVQQNGLQNTTIGFHQIKSLIKHTVHSCEEELKQIKQHCSKTISFIKAQEETKPTQIISYLEELEGKLKIPAHLNNFLQTLEEQQGCLAANMLVPIDTKIGIIQYKEVNFKKNASAWLDSETLPILYEIWEITEGAESSMKMSLTNLRNRAILLSNEMKDGKEVIFDKELFCQPLETLLKKVDNWANDIKKLEKIIEERLSSSFNVSSIYDTKKIFLPVSLQSTLSQYTNGQNKLLQQIRTQLAKPANFIKQFRDTVSEEEALSSSEKIVRTIQDRSLEVANAPYTSIFQTKGYIGESFWIGRERELLRVHNIIDQWNLGYRGSIILSGERLAGKSLFGEVIVNKHFQKEVIRLVPNTNMKTGGRKWSTTYDLKAALTYIKNNLLLSRSMVWIDDLELWQDSNISLGQNIRCLLDHIDSHSTQLFYMVSMSKWLERHLNKTNDLQKSFQASISLDKMSIAEIQQAIIIRHGATHKVLVGEGNREVSPEEFDKMTDNICRTSQGNIGESLNKWASSIYKLDDEHVIHRSSSNHLLPDFLNSNIAILLAAIFKEKRTNEYRLRRLFGSAFKEKYSNLLQRLLNMGVLIRELDGMLVINDTVANDLGRMLARKKYL